MVTTKQTVHGPKPQAAAVQGAKSLKELMRIAKAQVEDLTGLPSDCVSGLSKTNDGWHLVINLIELKRIPASTDVLATFNVTLDAEGNVASYHRSRRYLRSQIQEETS